MQIFKKISLNGVLFLAIVFFSFNAFSASEKIIYIHGYTLDTEAAFPGAPSGSGLELCNNRSDCSYWSQQLPGNVVHVGWRSAKDDWRLAPVLTLVNMLNNHCLSSSDISCAVICHSTGCPIVGRALANYGNQFSWSITRVLALGSAEGGSELGELVDNLGGLAAVFAARNAAFISPSIVRGAYNHNQTRGVQFFQGAGFDGSVQSFLLPGEDDGVVAYHSACAYVTQFSADKCSGDSRSSPVWYNPFRRVKVNQWANHQPISFCGRDGCDEDHTSIRELKYQQRVLKNNP